MSIVPGVASCRDECGTQGLCSALDSAARGLVLEMSGVCLDLRAVR